MVMIKMFKLKVKVDTKSGVSEFIKTFFPLTVIFFLE